MAKTNHPRQARINSQRLSYAQNLDELKNNLFNCNSIVHRNFINRRNEHQTFVEFQFANGTKSLSVENTQEVKQMLNDFLRSEGIFSITGGNQDSEESTTVK